MSVAYHIYVVCTKCNGIWYIFGSYICSQCRIALVLLAHAIRGKSASDHHSYVGDDNDRSACTTHIIECIQPYTISNPNPNRKISKSICTDGMLDIR